MDNQKVRLPYNTIESISKVLFYQNEKLLYEISKYKGWNYEDTIQKYLIDNQQKIEIVKEIVKENVKENVKKNNSKFDDSSKSHLSGICINEDKCYARVASSIYKQCSCKKNKGSNYCKTHQNIYSLKGELPYKNINETLPEPEKLSSQHLTEILRICFNKGYIDNLCSTKSRNEKINIIKKFKKHLSNF